MKLFLTLLLLPILSYAEECRPVSMQDMETLFKDVLSQHAPELLAREIPLGAYKSKAYFLQASVLKLPLLMGKKSYRLDVGETLLACPPSEKALRAIILHETNHFMDYESMPAHKVASLGENYVLSKSFRVHYERSTDMKVLQAQEGQGLIEYRQWLYDRLNEKQLKVKKETYLTPEEINTWMTSANP